MRPKTPAVGSVVLSRTHGPAVLFDQTAGADRVRLLTDADELVSVPLSDLAPAPTIRASWFHAFGDRDPHVRLSAGYSNRGAALLDAVSRVLEAEGVLPFGSWCPEYEAHIVALGSWPIFRAHLVRAGARVTGPAAAAGEDEL
jgi:hypothetical protein